jgi:hypothetical protein
MGKTIPINLAVNSYQSTSKPASSERLINMFAEPLPPTSPFKLVLYNTCGLTLQKDLGHLDPIWGMQIMGGHLYAVCGVTVYKIDASGDSVNLGDLSTTPARVMMTDNGSQLTILTDSGKAFYTDGTTLSEITDQDYQLSSSVTTLDGYTIFAKQNSNQIFISEVNNTASYNALEFTLVQSQSDNIVRVFANQGQLWIFKQYSTEIYYDSGNLSFPFQQVNGANVQRGCSAKFSVASDDTGIYWLGDDRVIYKAQGYNPQKISTFAIDAKIQNYGIANDAFAFIYTDRGHKFYCITFPTEGVTWEYDIITDLWHERQSHDITRWRANSMAFFSGQYLIGDYLQGLIFQTDATNYTENGSSIPNEIISATQFDDFSRVSVDRLLLKMDTGIGITDGQGSDPQIMLQVSTDGGYTWGNELWQPIGQIGEYNTLVFWQRLGFGRQFTFKFRISDPVRVAIQGCYLNVTEGYS